MSRLTFPQLAAFATLAETSSFREAAVRLGVSQPALSRTIQHIETLLDARLFDRDTRRVTLTPVGERLRPRVVKLLEEYEAMFRDLDSFVEGGDGLIRIAALPSAAAAFLPRAIKAFKVRAPNARFEIAEGSGETVHQLVRDRAADFGIAPPPASIAALRYREMFKDNVVLVCRSDDPLAEAERHPWTIFAERPFVAGGHDAALANMVESGLAQCGRVIDRPFTCRQASTIANLVIARHGISALTRLTMEQIAAPALTWRLLVEPALSRSIGIVRAEGRSIQPAAQAFLAEVEGQARVMQLSEQIGKVSHPSGFAINRQG